MEIAINNLAIAAGTFARRTSRKHPLPTATKVLH